MLGTTEVGVLQLLRGQYQVTVDVVVAGWPLANWHQASLISPCHVKRLLSNIWKTTVQSSPSLASTGLGWAAISATLVLVIRHPGWTSLMTIAPVSKRLSVSLVTVEEPWLRSCYETAKKKTIQYL